jgi:hypothetical protein
MGMNAVVRIPRVRVHQQFASAANAAEANCCHGVAQRAKPDKTLETPRPPSAGIFVRTTCWIGLRPIAAFSLVGLFADPIGRASDS